MKITQKKAIKILKSLSLISPLLFKIENFFYYEIKSISLYKKFVNDWNQYKVNKEEKNFLEKIIINYRYIKEDITQIFL